jgi:hypothetical protein
MSGATRYARELRDARVLLKPFNAQEVITMLTSCLPNDVQGRGDRDQPPVTVT